MSIIPKFKKMKSEKISSKKLMLFVAHVYGTGPAYVKNTFESIRKTQITQFKK